MWSGWVLQFALAAQNALGGTIRTPPQRLFWGQQDPNVTLAVLFSYFRSVWCRGFQKNQWTQQALGNRTNTKSLPWRTEKQAHWATLLEENVPLSQSIQTRALFLLRNRFSYRKQQYRINNTGDGVRYRETWARRRFAIRKRQKRNNPKEAASVGRGGNGAEAENLTYRGEVCKAQGGGFRRFSWRGGSKWIFSTKRVPKPLFILERVTAVSPEWLEWIGGLGKVCRTKLAYGCTFTWKV